MVPAWYLPGTDGDAHPRALERLQAGASVTLDQVVSAMMQESDNAAPDYLRDRLGDGALAAASARALATGEFGAGSELVRRHLEWQPPPPEFAGLGFKSGSLPGVLTDAIYIRRHDGTVATMVLLNRRMAMSTWTSAVGSGFAEQQLLLDAVTSPDTAHRLTCALRRNATG